jgi:tetratricopeptide (TPR) repeat protein
MTKVVGIYLWWLIVPLNIHSTILDVSIITSSIKDIRVLASLGALIIIFIYTIKIRRASPVRFFAIAWFFLTLLPVLNILLMPNIYASRFLYIPSIGFSLFFASAWKSLTGTMRRHFHPAPLTRLPGLFLAGILCSYGILTHLSCYTWENDTIFYYSIVQSYPRHPSAHAGMGDILHRQGLLHEAEQSFLTAVMLDPNYHEAYNSLGRVYIDQNRIEEAVEQFQKSTAINPGYATARINLCAAYGAGGDHNRAVACLEAFNADHPYDARAYHNLIVSYYHIGDHDKAAALLEQIPDARRASH